MDALPKPNTSGANAANRKVNKSSRRRRFYKMNKKLDFSHAVLVCEYCFYLQ